MPQPTSRTRWPLPISATAAIRSASGQENDWNIGSQRRQPRATDCHSSRPRSCVIAGPEKPRSVHQAAEAIPAHPVIVPVPRPVDHQRLALDVRQIGTGPQKRES